MIFISRGMRQADICSCTYLKSARYLGVLSRGMHLVPKEEVSGSHSMSSASYKPARIGALADESRVDGHVIDVPPLEDSNRGRP